MLHQMMMLLHLEMQLRQQALVSYSHATDPDTRLARLDEVLALNEQLNEVGGILSALLSNPIGRESLRASEASGLGSSRDSNSEASNARNAVRVNPGLNAGNVHIIQTRNPTAVNTTNDTATSSSNVDDNDGDDPRDDEGRSASQYGMIHRYSRAAVAAAVSSGSEAASEQESVVTSSGSTIQRRNSATRRPPSVSTERVSEGRQRSGSEVPNTNETRSSLLERRNSTQPHVARPASRASASASNNQNTDQESVTSLSGQSARPQSLNRSTRSTTLPPISNENNSSSGGNRTSSRTSSGLPAGSNAHQNVMQTLSLSRNNNSSSVPNRNTNTSAHNGPRLMSQQSSRTITIDATLDSERSSPQARPYETARRNSSEFTTTVPNSVVRQSLSDNATESSESHTYNNQVREGTYAPQRRFSRQNSATRHSVLTPRQNEPHQDVPITRRSDSGSRMTGLATRRSSTERPIRRSQPSSSHSRPLLQRRNSRDASVSRQPAENATNRAATPSRARTQSVPAEVQGRNNRSTLNAGSRGERLDRARRRSEIAQELLNERVRDSTS